MNPYRFGRFAIAGLPLALIAAPLVGDPAASPSDGAPPAARIEMHLRISDDRIDAPQESCDAVQDRSPTAPVAFAFWGTLPEAGSPAGCGAGSLQAAATLLTVEATADVGWDPGAMDPGPFGGFAVFLTLRTRQRTGLSKEGPPQYGVPTTDQRAFRLEPGDEFVVPLSIDSHARETLGVHQVLVRVRIGWAGRDKATEYGALAVTHAAPGSEVLLDGGLAGHAGTDGSLFLSALPVGEREVRLRSASGALFSRMVLIVKGRTVPLTPEASNGGTAPPPALESAGRNAEGFREYRRARDGATMIEIPEGEFLMGNLETEGKPQPHTVFVSTFLIDKLPLTVARYRQFATATGRPLPPDPYWGVHEGDPVAFVRWEDGKAYCEWAGGRLATEAEREKATRGTDGRLFPWGSDPPSEQRAVYGHFWGEAGNDTAGARPAGAGPYGMLDGEGNMWEFCEDWWSPDYYATSPSKDPLGPKTGRARVVRGGSWDSRWVTLSTARRNFEYTGYREGDFGFRCAANPVR
jgi:formylglycine-generating enzyme required for sulfatase activity